MKITRRPMLATILFGLLCGVVFIPVNMVVGYIVYSPAAFRLAIWIYREGKPALYCLSPSDSLLLCLLGRLKQRVFTPHTRNP
jgi:hypothetical protein